MRHYEVVLMICVDYSAEVDTLAGKYRDLIVGLGGCVHSLEDWGRRQLAYPIAGMSKAHYLLMNIEVAGGAVGELRTEFGLSRAVMRSMILRVRRVITESSEMKRGDVGKEGEG